MPIENAFVFTLAMHKYLYFVIAKFRFANDANYSHHQKNLELIDNRGRKRHVCVSVPKECVISDNEPKACIL